MNCEKQKECQNHGAQCSSPACYYVGTRFSSAKSATKKAGAVVVLDSCRHCGRPYAYCTCYR